MDSHYHPPGFDELTQFISELNTRSQSNRSELALLESLKLYDVPGSEKILLGAIIYVTEKIASEYKVLSPSGGYLNKGSALYKELNNGPHNTADNRLDDKYKLIYLRDFYHYARDRKLTLSSTETKDTRALDKAIKPIVDNIAANMSLDVKSLLNHRPLLSTLIKQTSNLADEYKNILSQRPKSFITSLPVIGRLTDYSPKHKQYANLTKLLTPPVMNQILPSLVDDKSVKGTHTFDQYHYTICYGAILSIMGEIENEYSGYTLNSAEKNSTLHKLCQKILNISCVNDVPPIQRIIYYQDFIAFLELVLANKKFIYMFEKELGPDTKVFLKNLQKNVITMTTAEPFILSCIKCIGNYALMYVLGVAFFEAGAVMYDFGIGKNVVTEMGTLIGRALIGGKLGEYIGKSTGSKIEPAVTISALANALWFLSRRIKEQFYPKVHMKPFTCKVAKQFSLELSEEIKIDKTEKAVYENEALRLLEKLDWMKAYLELPSSVSDEIKARVNETVIEPAEEKLVHNKAGQDYDFSRLYH